MCQIEAKIAAGRRHGRCSNRSGKSVTKSSTDRIQRTILGRLALPVFKAATLLVSNKVPVADEVGAVVGVP
jgi:hypothetical protein